MNRDRATATLVPMTPLGLSLTTFLSTFAAAQDFDARGMALPPEGAGVRDPTLGLGGARTGAPTITTLVDVNSGLLVRRIVQGPNVEDVALVDDLVGTSLSFQTGLYKGLGLGIAMPLWFFSDGLEGGGPAAGDLSLWVPVEIVHDEWGSVGVVPLVTLPTGAAGRSLGETGAGGGGIVSGQANFGALFAALDAGLDVSPRTDVPEWPGGLHYRYAADFGVAPIERLGLHLEARGRAPFDSQAPSLPLELLGTTKVEATERIFVTATAGRALTRGVGAGGFRLYTGVTIVPGKKPVEAEIVTEPPPKEVHIIDDRRFPISGATITANGATGVSDIEGYAGLPPRSVKEGTIRIEHPNYEPIELPVDPDAPFYEAQLKRKPVQLAASVVGPQGSLMLVEVEVEGPYDPGPATVDEAGVRHWELKEGTWYVRMSSPGLGSQERTIVIEPGRTEPIRVDAVLTPAIAANNLVRVQVVDRLGRPVEDAVVALEDRDLGTTGTGGDLAVSGLQAGAGALTIRSEQFGEGARVELIIPEEGEQVVQAVVDWRPGSVQVQAVDPRGQPIDATVNFIGPANLPPRGTGSDGTELFVVRPGTWNVEVTAPGMGTQIRTIEVTDEAGELVVVDVDLTGDEKGPAELTVRVFDVDGKPVPDVHLALDGKPIGATGPGGDITLQGLKSGRRTLATSGALVRGGQREIELQEGRQATDMSVRWIDGVTLVTAVDNKDGYPVDALIDAEGPVPVAEVQLGADGAEQLVLAPGEWVIKASAPARTTQERKYTVTSGSGRRGTLGFRMVPEGAPEGAEVAFLDTAEVPSEAPAALAVTITDAQGNPVEATVRLHTEDGRAPSGSLVAVGGNTTVEAPPGKAQLLIEAPGMETQVVDVELAYGSGHNVVVAMEPRNTKDGASVLIKAETERGDALVGAEVRVNGELVGTTGYTGTWELVDVPDESVEVTITPKNAEAYQEITVPVVVSKKAERDGEEVAATVIVPDAARTIAVSVVDPYGNAVQAQVLAVQGANEAAVTDVATNKDGALILAPGSYTITAMTETGEIATTELVVPTLDPRAGADVAYTFIPGADPTGRSADGAAMITDTSGTPTLALRVEQVSAAITDGALVPVNPILFDTGSHTLRADAMPLVADLARWLNAHREASLIEVGGHTDDVGGVVYNQQLSERRAESVMQALIRYGVAQERLRARGYGLSRPVTANSDEANRQRNRRVALVVLDWQE